MLVLARLALPPALDRWECENPDSNASGQVSEMARDLAWPGDPDLVRVLLHVFQQATQALQPERLAGKKAVQGDGKDLGIARGGSA